MGCNPNSWAAAPTRNNFCACFAIELSPLSKKLMMVYDNSCYLATASNPLEWDDPGQVHIPGVFWQDARPGAGSPRSTSTELAHHPCGSLAHRSSPQQRSGERPISRRYWLVASRVASRPSSVIRCHSFLVRETTYFLPL